MQRMENAFQLLAAPRRREILRIVWSEERTAGDILRAMPDVTFGAISQHLRRLAHLDEGLRDLRGVVGTGR